MVSRFEWDADKDRSNQEKHGTTFAEALSVFADVNGILIADPDHSSAEERFILIGISAQIHILIVCHCYREADSVIRIISARKAVRHERFTYEERLP